MNIEEAEEIITKKINEPDPSWPDKPAIVILSEQTIQRHWGWVFFYNSQRFLNTGNVSDALVGNAPYIVNRRSGEISLTGTTHPIDYYIKQYERELKHGG